MVYHMISTQNKHLKFILDLPSISQLVETMKTVEVRPAKSSGTEAATRSQTFDTGRPVDTQKPYLLKLLIGLCIGQLITMIATAAVLGSFVNSHVSLSYRTSDQFLCMSFILNVLSFFILGFHHILSFIRSHCSSMFLCFDKNVYDFLSTGPKWMTHIRISCPYPLLLYNKTKVYRGIHYFLIFALKHRVGYSLEPPN